MMQIIIDINADLGEGAGNDAQIMPLISSCNVACGGHAGTRETIATTIRLAKKYKVKVGAHPSYPDKENFGRKVFDIPNEDLEESLLQQLRLFQEVCVSEDVEMHHIKLHGALYNQAAKDEAAANVVLNVLAEIGQLHTLYVPFNSVLHRAVNEKYPLLFEAFIDRRYTSEGALAPRSHAKGIIRTPEEVWQQLFRIIKEKKVKTINGEEVAMIADTFCIHGDHKNSLEILNHIHDQMKRHNITL